MPRKAAKTDFDNLENKINQFFKDEELVTQLKKLEDLKNEARNIKWYEFFHLFSINLVEQALTILLLSKSGFNFIKASFNCVPIVSNFSSVLSPSMSVYHSRSITALHCLPALIIS